MKSLRLPLWTALLLVLTACGARQPAATTPTGAPVSAVGNVPASTTGVVERQQPPPVGPPQDVHFPTITRHTLPNGLEVNFIRYSTLPVLHLRLVARAAGTAADPANLPGLAAFTGDMLKEGTRGKNSAQIAETIEFVGGTLTVTTGPDSTEIAIAVLREHAETALSLLAELVTEPTFPQGEIDKLRRREIDRLTQMQQDPSWLSRRAFFPLVYGRNPYGRFDTTVEVLRRISRNDLVQFHRARFVGGSMFLAAVGDLEPEAFRGLVTRTLGRVRRGTAPTIEFPAPPERTERQVVIVDRPNSAQSVIRIGNIALRRASEDYIPLSVANQVLGAEPSSRLFMELRERRSLTYGAYSRVTANVESGTFQASASVRTPVTGEALVAFFEQLDRIVREAPPEEELREAQSFLIDSFPLSIETAGEIAGHLVELRLYGLPDTYWDSFRSRIGQVTSPQSLTAAQRYIHPDHALVVIVGAATAFEEAARQLGPVRVIDLAGRVVRELPARPAAPAAPTAPTP
jgi:predicted Zn-dependent peptidase